jgi:nitrate/nitrite transporter NarK
MLYLLFFMIGFGFGASALTFALVRQTFPIIESGIVSGVANTGGFLSAVLLPSIFGFILDHVQSALGSVGDGYYYGFITPVLFSMIGLIGVIFIRE